MVLTCWSIARLAPPSVGEEPITGELSSLPAEPGSLPDSTVHVVDGVDTVTPVVSHGPKSHVFVTGSVGSSGEKAFPFGIRYKIPQFVVTLDTSYQAENPPICKNTNCIIVLAAGL